MRWAVLACCLLAACGDDNAAAIDGGPLPIDSGIADADPNCTRWTRAVAEVVNVASIDSFGNQAAGHNGQF